MAKRKLTSLRSVLLRYLLLCGGGCALILVLWWVIFMQLINIGFLLPAVASAQACADARETVASMTADTFDSLQISDLCRWAVVQNDTVLQTNMNDRHLKIALNAFHGGSGNLGYQYDVKMADGSFCLLQYDYATPYADPALRARGFAPYYLYRQKYMSGSFENVGWCISGAEGLYNIYIMEELHSILSLGAGGSTKMVDAKRNRIERVFHPKFPLEYIQRPEKLTENLEAFRRFHQEMAR